MFFDVLLNLINKFVTKKVRDDGSSSFLVTNDDDKYSTFSSNNSREGNVRRELLPWLIGVQVNLHISSQVR